MSETFIRYPFGGDQTVETIVGAEQFPNDVNGVITLPDNASYITGGTIDLQGKRIVAGRNVSFFGLGTENCILKSTGLSDPLITSNYSLQLQNITITADHALDLDATDNPNQALDWLKVNFTDCAVVGTIKNYTNVISAILGFLNSDGLTFDGTFGTISFSNTIFTGTGSGTSIILPSTLEITRRFRVVDSAFVAFGSQIGIDVQSATIPVEGHILEKVNFSGGATYVQGIASNDIEASWSECRGIANSATISYITMNGNATATTIAATGTPVKIAGATTSQAITQKFTNTDNRATYTGGIDRTFMISAIISAISGNNNQIGLYVAKNGAVIDSTEIYATTGGTGRAESIKVQGIVDLATNDYIELFIENDTAIQDITVQDYSLIVEASN